MNSIPRNLNVCGSLTGTEAGPEFQPDSGQVAGPLRAGLLICEVSTCLAGHQGLRGSMEIMSMNALYNLQELTI